MDPQGPTPAKRMLFRGILLVGVPALVFAVLEGFSSAVILLRDISRPYQQAIPNQAMYDTLLGWIPRPGVRADSMFGPGISFHTNKRGLRGSAEFARAVPAGRQRGICSGDSFTVGWGVSDSEAWCALLASANARFETLNFGGAGYGVDQAYLRYKRDAVAFDHDFHIFAFISHDFKRMTMVEYGGFGKPILERRGEKLEARNVPVPTRYFLVPGLAARFHRTRPAFARLRMAQLTRAILARVGPAPPTEAELDRQSWHLAEAAFADLAAISRQRRHELIAVLLPERGDWDDTASRKWSQGSAASAHRNGFRFVDLVEAYRRLPGDSARLLFFSPGDRRGTHLTPAGNRWVADQLRPYLHPESERVGTGGP